MRERDSDGAGGTGVILGLRGIDCQDFVNGRFSHQIRSVIMQESSWLQQLKKKLVISYG